MWKKKLREYKGKYENYSIRKKLNREKKINSNFETILNSLTLEEIIALKLELAASHVNHKLYGFPILKSLKFLVRESCIMFALSVSRTAKDAACVLEPLKDNSEKKYKNLILIRMTATMNFQTTLIKLLCLNLKKKINVKKQELNLPKNPLSVIGLREKEKKGPKVVGLIATLLTVKVVTSLVVALKEKSEKNTQHAGQPRCM